MDEVIAHPRAHERHPNLQNADVLSAWDNRIVVRRRYANASDRLVSIGSDSNGRLIEMVASQIPNGTWVIFHAMTPPSHKTLKELGLIRR
jgi:hypothetical protein